MKRAREDSTSGPQLKRPASVSGESSEQPNKLTTEDALAYLKAVKEKFKDDNGKYSEFLEVMKDFKAQRIDTAGVIGRVKDLFKGHNKLILGFNAFLPKNFQIVLPEEKKQPVEFDQAINFVNKIKNRFNNNERVYKAFLEILNKYRKGTKVISEVYDEVATLFCDHPDLLEEFTKFLPDSGHAVPRQLKVRDERMGSVRSSQYEKAVKKETERKEQKKKSERDKDDEKEKDDYDDLDGQRLPTKRKSARRADELIRRQSQTAEGTSTQMEYAFFEKVKSRLRNRESYKELLKILNLYTEQIINRGELHSLAADILGKHPDLLEGFNNLLSQSESVEGSFGGVFARRLESEGMATKTRERDHDKEKDEKERDKEKSKEGQKMSLLASKDKFTCKPISELDLSNCESCSPSYRLLPKNYLRLTSSHRKALANEVLNDCWVSVTSGSEDSSSFRHLRRNQYEESLFRCEDDRFELDMLLESTAATAKRVGEIVDKLDSGQLENSIRIDDHLSAINMRSIERIYGDHGLDILDLMRKNPQAVLPVVHCRLRQKHEEWLKCRDEMNKVWREVYAKNYHKSLDHRSFYFKQQDKKSLSSKGLIAEIKEIHEKKRKEDDAVLHMIMGIRKLPTPDMKFEYPDTSIHQDLYQIMKYSADEVCNTMEQSEKIMRVWRTFLEPVFGVPPRPRGTDDTEEAVKTQSSGSKEQQRSSSGESAASGGHESSPENGKAAHEECASSKPRKCKKDKGEDAGKHAGHRDVRDGGRVEEAKSSSRHERNAGKGEREEGELSPEREPEKNRSKKENIPKEDMLEDAEEHHNTEADDEGEESAQKSSEDSENENASEAGEEVSGSDVGDQEGSRDDHEEDEDEEGDEDEHKADSDCEGADNTDGEGISSPDRLTMYCKPLAAHVDGRKESTIFYGNDMFYILFRIHQILYDRIYSAKTNATGAEQKWKNAKDNAPRNLYDKFVRALYDLLDGTVDNAKFEDECRSIIGTQAYVLFTLDKLIYKLVKQLQHVAGDETANRLIALFSYEQSRGPSASNDLVYHANTCGLLHNENIYRFEISSNASELSIQLMNGDSDKPEPPASTLEHSFSNYLTEFLLTAPDPNKVSKTFLRRNLRKAPPLQGANTLLFNGLEHKISCKTSKVSYVLDTEDVFYRAKRRAAGSSRRGSGQFKKWIETKVGTPRQE